VLLTAAGLIGCGGNDASPATIIKSHGASESWTPQARNTTSSLSCVHFVDEKVGWAVGERGAIFKTSNGGGS